MEDLVDITSFDNLGKLKGLIKVADKDLKYFKHSNLIGSTERSVTTTSKSAYDESIPQLTQRNQDIKGSYRIDKKLITLFESHDVSTLNHELGHRFYYTLSPKERGILHEVFGVKGEWKVKHHEAFADAYARYIAEGKTTHTGLRAIFEKMKAFTKEILLKLKENNNGNLPPLSKEAKEFFAATLGDEKARTALMEKYKAKDAGVMGEGELFQVKEKQSHQAGVDANSAPLHQASRNPEPLPISNVGNQSFVSRSERIANFNNFFKDSKVTNSDGTPKIVYHGTSADFNVFNKEKSNGGNYGRGFYFAEKFENVNKHWAKGENKSNVMPLTVILKASGNRTSTDRIKNL